MNWFTGNEVQGNGLCFWMTPTCWPSGQCWVRPRYPLCCVRGGRVGVGDSVRFLLFRCHWTLTKKQIMHWHINTYKKKFTLCMQGRSLTSNSSGEANPMRPGVSPSRSRAEPWWEVQGRSPPTENEFWIFRM